MKGHRYFHLLALLASAVLLSACVASGPAIPEAKTPTKAPRLRVAFTSAAELGDVPALMAHELLVKQGYEVVPVFYAKPELAVEAMARGDADIGYGSTRTFWAAVAKGAALATVMEEQANSWQIVAASSIRTCADLDGRRFSISGDAAVSTAMSNAYIHENCPSVQRQIVLIAGSESRAAALLAGEIDAATLEFSDLLQLQERAPGRFHSLVDFAAGLPNLKTTDVHVSRGFATAHPEAVKDVIRAMLTIHRQINKDHNLLVAAAGKWLQIDPQVLPKVVEAHFAINSWNVNGGMTGADVQYSLDFFTNTGSLPAGLGVQDVSDLSYLSAVLLEMGRQ